MPTETPVPADDPLMIAWRAYQATEEYHNTRKWALHEAHVDGSLWAAFLAGYAAKPVSVTSAPTALLSRPGEPEADITEVVQRMETELAQARRALRALSVGQNGLCWDRYGCWATTHDDLCLMAYAALRARAAAGDDSIGRYCKAKKG